MLTLEDCVAFGALSSDEVNALAAHEHLPDIVACELGAYLMNIPGGANLIAEDLRADLLSARLNHRPDAANHLRKVLASFERHHCDTLS
jgi:hypothetical protein